MYLNIGNGEDTIIVLACCVEDRLHRFSELHTCSFIHAKKKNNFGPVKPDNICGVRRSDSVIPS